MSQKRLPDRPDLEHLKREARTLLDEMRTAAPSTKLSDAQRELARSYGYASWPKLKQYVDAVALHSRKPHEVATFANAADEFLALACLRYGYDEPARITRAQAMLDADPSLATANVRTMAAVGAIDALRDALRADPGAANRNGGPFAWPPLLYLAYSRVWLDPSGATALDTARVLLDAGADPNAGYLWDGLPSPFTVLTGVFGEGEGGPSMEPAHPQWRALARLLLERGAEVNDTQTLYNRHFEPGTEWLELLFQYGLGTGDGGPWRRLLGGPAYFNTPAQNLEDQLVWAAWRGYGDRVALLLAHGVDPEGTGMNHPVLRGRNAMQLAVDGGYDDIVAMLETAGAARPEMDEVDQFIYALLTGAAAPSPRGDLLAAAHARRPHLLAEAVVARKATVVPTLRELGWDVNHKDSTTALHEAAGRGDEALVDVLLAQGADPTIVDDRFDGTPAGWARHGGHEALAARLDAAG